jgi:hypothetical protein
MIDYVKEYKYLYLPKSEPVIVEVPKMKFLMIDGKGAPDPIVGRSADISEFQAAVGALYGLTYTIKMSEKSGTQPNGYENFKVPPLEALWWMDDGTDFDTAKPLKWRWTAMIRMPEFVSAETVNKFANTLVEKKKNEIYKHVKLDYYEEGLSVQIMHIGPYSDEAPNINKMLLFAESEGYKKSGKHHEIYYGDPRRSAPEKLKTVLRQPVSK